MKFVSSAPYSCSVVDVWDCFVVTISICLYASDFNDCLLQTCLSEGKGYHFPPCHLLNICGFQLLFDCPLDLSALSVFSPLPITLSGIPDEYTSACSCETTLDLEHGSRKEKIEKPLDASSLIHAEPWYKTVKSLKLWNISFIDIVLISSPMGILGLPFLTRSKEFSAKVNKNDMVLRIDILNLIFCKSFTLLLPSHIGFRYMQPKPLQDLDSL